MAKARDMGLDKRCFILVGVGPLASAKAARWMRANVAGVHIPDAVIARLDRAADQKAEGKRICIEMIQELREEPGVAGVHVMAYRQEQTVAEIVHESGVLRGRAPWRRDFIPKMQPVESLEADDLRHRASSPCGATMTPHRDAKATCSSRSTLRRAGRASRYSQAILEGLSP